MTGAYSQLAATGRPNARVVAGGCRRLARYLRGTKIQIVFNGFLEEENEEDDEARKTTLKTS